MAVPKPNPCQRKPLTFIIPNFKGVFWSKRGSELPQTQVISPQFSHTALAELEGEGRAKGPPLSYFQQFIFVPTHSAEKLQVPRTHQENLRET